jgi:hypothetical protein
MERKIGKNADGSGRSLFEGSVQIFRLGKVKINLRAIAVSAEILTKPSGIKVRTVTLSVILVGMASWELTRTYKLSRS